MDRRARRYRRAHKDAAARRLAADADAVGRHPGIGEREGKSDKSGKGKRGGKVKSGKFGEGRDENFSQRMYHGGERPCFEGARHYCGKAESEHRKRLRDVATADGKPIGATPGQSSGENKPQVPLVSLPGLGDQAFLLAFPQALMEPDSQSLSTHTSASGRRSRFPRRPGSPPASRRRRLFRSRSRAPHGSAPWSERSSDDRKYSGGRFGSAPDLQGRWRAASRATPTPFGHEAG